MTTSLLLEGKRGEDIATDFLIKKGYRIVERNFRIKGGEIDIIATHRNILVFIEVKTRLTSEFGTPLEAITYWKLKALIKTSQYYKLTHKNLPDSLRIDAIGVDFSSSSVYPNIEHIENITQ